MKKPSTLESWKNLELHAESIEGQHMRDWFSADKKRFEHFSIRNESISSRLFEKSRYSRNDG